MKDSNAHSTCANCSLLLDALLAHLDNDLKHYKNRIKYIDSGDTWTKEQKIKYYEREIEYCTMKKNAIKRRFGK